MFDFIFKGSTVYTFLRVESKSDIIKGELQIFSDGWKDGWMENVAMKWRVTSLYAGNSSSSSSLSFSLSFSPSPVVNGRRRTKEEKFFLSLSARFVDDRKPYISFLFLRVVAGIVKGTYERQRAGNLRRQRVPGTSLHLFYKWTRAQGEGKTRGNKCQRDFMARSNDFSLPRTTPWNNELAFCLAVRKTTTSASPAASYRIADSSLTARSFFRGREKRKKKKRRRQVRISMIYFLLCFHSMIKDKSILFSLYLCIIEYFYGL